MKMANADNSFDVDTRSAGSGNRDAKKNSDRPKGSISRAGLH
jgi:hypothetical protein